MPVVLILFLIKHIVTPQKAFGTPVCEELHFFQKRLIRLGSIFMLFPSLTPMMNVLQRNFKHLIIL